MPAFSKGSEAVQLCPKQKEQIADFYIASSAGKSCGVVGATFKKKEKK